MEMENELTEKQEVAILALVAGASRSDAAKTAGVAESTIYAWLTDETFRQRLQDAKSRVFDEATARLYGLASAAIESLKRGLDGKAKAVEIRTAIAVFNQVTRFREIELIERIEKLEKLFEAKK